MPLSVILHMSIMGLALCFIIVAVVLVKRKTGSQWVKKHRSRAITGGALAVSGVVTIAVFKSIKGFPHLASPHAVAGLVTVITVLAALALGTMLMSGNAGLRLIHRIAGWTALVLFVITAVSGILRLMALSG
ncbi:MAG TPA: hypothetical protein PLI62_12160 [Spirochaetota bacterium]|nr:hypothetical protein [Spirochaetota bacterium]